MTAQQPLTYDAFVELAAADPAVVGLVLKGSRAHDDMVTPTPTTTSTWSSPMTP